MFVLMVDAAESVVSVNVEVVQTPVSVMDWVGAQRAAPSSARWGLWPL
jgi:hypothetical protein